VGSERSSIIERHSLHRIRSCASEPQVGVVLRRVSTARNEYGVAAMLCSSASPASASLAASRSMIISSQGIAPTAPGWRRSRDRRARLRYSSTFWAECPTRRTAVARPYSWGDAEFFSPAIDLVIFREADELRVLRGAFCLVVDHGIHLRWTHLPRATAPTGRLLRDGGRGAGHPSLPRYPRRRRQ
jgi:hypothetical protein